MGDQPPYGQPPMQSQSAGAKWGATSMGMESHIAAGLSYLTPIAGLIFFLMEKTNKFVRFHAMQSIILGVGYVVWFFLVFIVQIAISGATTVATNGASTGFGLGCIVGCIGWLGGLAFFAGWLWGIISAFMGRYQKLPVIGDLAEKWAGGPAQPAF
ncbi:MAG TPA: hypothetical protein VH591_11340 [Ktedonobacterales bacterium]